MPFHLDEVDIEVTLPPEHDEPGPHCQSDEPARTRA